MAKTKAQLKEESRKAAKRVRDRNYRFKKMPRDRQRMAIARDVIKFLDDKKFAATRGEYLEAEVEKQALYSSVDPEIKLKEFIAIPSVTCNVCAVGAVFTAGVLGRGIDGCDPALSSEYDGRKYFSGTPRADMVKELRPYFTSEELDRMENFFEDTSIGFDLDLDDDDALRAIMEHIIATGGESVVPKL